MEPASRVRLGPSRTKARDQNAVEVDRWANVLCHLKKSRVGRATIESLRGSRKTLDVLCSMYDGVSACLRHLD